MSSDHALLGLDATLIDLLPAAVYVCEATSGLIVRYNRRAAQLWGREPAAGDTQERFCGSHRLYLPDGTPLPHARTPMADVLRTGEPIHDREVVIERPDGSRITALVNSAAIRDDSGHILGAVNVFQDITERNRAEAALRESEESHRDLVENANDIIYSHDLVGNLTSWNRAGERLLGYTADEIRGINISQLVVPEQLERARQMIANKLVQGGRTIYELDILSKDGRRLTVEISSRVAHPFGQPPQVQGMARDITERKRAEAALREADRRKDEFMAMLAHELRNPLAPIRNSLHILHLRGGDWGVVDQVRGMMERQVGHLTRLVDDLLDVSRITLGKLQLRKERLDLVHLVRQAASDHRAAFEARRVTLRLDCPETPLWVSGDATRLAQVLDNLLANALKFTGSAGEVSVTITSRPESGQVLLTVRDDGAGIEPEMLPRLFETFSQGDRTLDRSHGGLGLGLAIVKGLAELHGGSVRAESAGLGQGASFTVTLPQAEQPPSLSCGPILPKQVGQRLRVLIVEDNRDAADSLCLLLKTFGYEVTVAYSGLDGVRSAEEHPPEVVICDIGLPGMDGYRVAAALRGSPATAGAHLIALTGYGQDEDRQRAREAGFDEHLTKPADPTVLEELLCRAGKSA